MLALREKAVCLIDMMDDDALRLAVSTLEDLATGRGEQSSPIDWDSFVCPGGRALCVEAYMDEMRRDDRL